MPEITDFQTAKAWDLIGHEGQFRIPGGRTLYEAVLYSTATATSSKVRLARFDTSKTHLHQVNRYVDGDADIEVLEDYSV